MASWDTNGNAGNPVDAFLGTTDKQPLIMKTNASEAMRIDPNGNIGIQTGEIYHALQIGGGYDGNLGFDGSDGTPNAGYIRFGDNTGWKLHIARQREQGGGAPLNSGTTGVLVTINDNGDVDMIGTLSITKDLIVWNHCFFREAVIGILEGGSVTVESLEGGIVTAESLFVAGPKSFRIDHPLDPANKYLSHACVESPEVKTLYDGIAELDNNGESVIELPEWFEVVNKDFRYQLTCIGGFAPVYVAEEIVRHRFRICGGKPGLRVSWQVTGIRHDPVAKSRPLVVEQHKPDDEKGLYQNPEAYGQPQEKGIRYKRDVERNAKMSALNKRDR